MVTANHAPDSCKVILPNLATEQRQFQCYRSMFAQNALPVVTFFRFGPMLRGARQFVSFNDILIDRDRQDHAQKLHLQKPNGVILKPTRFEQFAAKNLNVLESGVAGLPTVAQFIVN